MSEQKYQTKIIREYKKKGWYVIKIIKASPNGLPDLLLLKENEKPLFIEVKGVKGVTSELQKYRIKELKSLGFNAEIKRCKQKPDKLCLKKTGHNGRIF